MSFAVLAASGLVMAIGAIVQGVAGFGLALVAVPVIALLDPSLVPIPMLLTTSVHSVLSVAREYRDVDWHGVGWAMLGRLPGTVVGVLVVDSLPQRGFSAVVGFAVLACVAVSLISWKPSPTPRALVTAGLASGAFGTAMSIGGPPVALLYQHAEGAQIRATLAAYFCLGSATSVGAFAVAGKITTEHLLSGAALLPFLLFGFLLSGPLRRFLDAGRMRFAVLAVASGSALFLLARSVIG